MKVSIEITHREAAEIVIECSLDELLGREQMKKFEQTPTIEMNQGQLVKGHISTN